MLIWKKKKAIRLLLSGCDLCKWVVPLNSFDCVSQACHSKSNITEWCYRTDEERRWHFTFLVPFLQSPPALPEEPWVIFSPIQYFKRNHACQSCLYRWQLPQGMVTVHGPLFQFETVSMLGHLLWSSENSLSQKGIKKNVQNKRGLGCQVVSLGAC